MDSISALAGPTTGFGVTHEVSFKANMKDRCINHRVQKKVE
jgi:hypothetical protein